MLVKCSTTELHPQSLESILDHYRRICVALTFAYFLNSLRNWNTGLSQAMSDRPFKRPNFDFMNRKAYKNVLFCKFLIVIPSLQFQNIYTISLSQNLIRNTFP